MRVLLIHQNFPGQFRHLAPALAAAGHQVVAIGNRTDRSAPPGVRLLCAGGSVGDELRQPTAEARCSRQFAQGRLVARQLQLLAQEGWCPDVVVGHPFWGDLLFLDDVFPQVPLVALMEMDLLGLPQPEAGPRAAGPGLLQWTTLQAARRMAAGITATQFQRSTFPPWLQGRIAVIHEGVDLEHCRPAPVTTARLPDGTVLRVGEPLITFSCRSLEPLRGFPALMRALPMVLERHPTVRVVVCGEDRSAYGPAPAGGSWVRHLLEELRGRLDLSRVHFLGLLPHAALLNLFRFSSAHVYLTAPYVLSWSLLEAMACGALVVGSRTAPVQEVIEHGVDGLLVPLDQPQELAATLLEVLAQPAGFAHLRLGARRRIARDFDHRVCLAHQIELITTAARGIDPLSAAEARADG